MFPLQVIVFSLLCSGVVVWYPHGLSTEENSSEEEGLERRENCHVLWRGEENSVCV